MNAVCGADGRTRNGDDQILGWRGFGLGQFRFRWRLFCRKACDDIWKIDVGETFYAFNLAQPVLRALERMRPTGFVVF